ncbi:MAG: hypothetical protein MRZ46_07300 [Oscillospiraceae bacterium]|nr:hypothetical protein [Oscillospiraceae bacterium]MDY3257063.1 hypothetical protein [Ruminococcus callidus]
MITNKNLYEMLSAQITDSNEALREQLKSQVLESASKSEKSVVEELSEKYTSEINNLKTEFNNQLEKLHDNLKEETFEKLDTQMTQILKVNQNLAENIVNLQKDTAIIMETLQLLLTNMMLNKVPDKIDSSEH